LIRTPYIGVFQQNKLFADTGTQQPNGGFV
jgi:hypothetical protein